MNNFIIVIVDSKLVLRQRVFPLSYIFTVKVAEWDLHEHGISKAMLFAEQKMDEIERNNS